MTSPAPRRSIRSRAEATPTQPTAGPSTPARSLGKSSEVGRQPSSRTPRTPRDVVAGPGSSPAVGSSPVVQGVTSGQARRVLPARIRRAAGGGQEGIRDLEEMIVDWLERYGAYYVLSYSRCEVSALFKLQANGAGGKVRLTYIQVYRQTLRQMISQYTLLPSHYPWSILQRSRQPLHTLNRSSRLHQRVRTGYLRLRRDGRIKSWNWNRRKKLKHPAGY
jgi:hypothetical protein